MGITRWFTSVLVFLMICVTLCPLVVKGDDTFKPTMPTRPLPQDWNNNGIADTLDREIADKIAIGKGDEYVSVVVMVKYEPSSLELGAFAAAGGNVTAGPWKYAIYGFGGSIQYDNINRFAQSCPDLIFMEKESGARLGPPQDIYPTNITIPDYSSQILLFVMLSIVFFIFAAKKIAENKKRSYFPRVPESP